MFELDQAVDAWCRSIHTSAYNRNERLEELKDHLYCVVERFRTEGLSEQQAFSKATEHMGDVGMLAIEHAKNKSLRFKFCQTEENLEKWRDSTSPKSAAAMNIGSLCHRHPFLNLDIGTLILCRVCPNGHVFTYCGVLCPILVLISDSK